MNGALLNIWRETGGYLRYGDGKCLFLAGLSFSLLISFLRHSFSDQGSAWNIYAQLVEADVGATSWLAITAFMVAFASAAFAALPSLSNGLTKARFINRFGVLFSWAAVTPSNGGLLYFLEIAKHDSAERYEAALQQANAIGSQVNAADQEPIRQIWAISQIASSKFIAANIAILSIVFGFLLTLT